MEDKIATSALNTLKMVLAQGVDDLRDNIEKSENRDYMTGYWKGKLDTYENILEWLEKSW